MTVDYSIVMIVKNEANYLLEWLAFHKVVGFNKFVIYENNSTDNTFALLERLHHLGEITVIPWPSRVGESPQVSAYNHYFKSKALTEGTAWAAVIDCDEFIVPILGNTISEVMEEFEDLDGVGFNWRVFGSSNAAKMERKLIIDRFRLASLWDHSANRHVKSIVRPQRVSFASVHICQMEGSGVVDEKRRMIDWSRQGDHHFVSHDSLQINHYFTKSKEEWDLKRSRGRAAPAFGEDQQVRDNKMFAQMDLNEVGDYSIQRYLARTVEEYSKLARLVGENLLAQWNIATLDLN